MGVASVLLGDGTEEGRRCMPFDYTGKTIVTIAMYKKGEEDEICQVKKLKDSSHTWVQNFRHADDLWEEELVDKIKGIARAKQQQLTEHSITKVGDIKHATTNKLCEISSNSRNNFTLTSLLKIQESVQ